MANRWVDLNLTTTDMVTELYVATLGRAPDKSGLAYWVGQVSSGAMTIAQVEASFFAQPETQAMYPPGTTDTAFVTAVYNNALGRAPDTAGLNYWVGQLGAGNVTRPDFILIFLQGAYNDPAAVPPTYDSNLLSNLHVAAEYFAGVDSSGAVVNPNAIDYPWTGTQTEKDNFLLNADRVLNPVTGNPATGAASIDASKALTDQVDAGQNIGLTYTLTSNIAPDIFALTTANDTVTGAVGTLQTGDTIVDVTTTDHDKMVVSVSSYATGAVQPTVTNVENINMVGTVLATGLDLANVTGTKVLTLSSATAGSTGTVDVVAATRAASIVAGTNIGTLNVNAAKVGTGGSVAVNTGTATTTTITGNAGSDTFAVTVGAAGQTLNLLGAAGTDVFNVTLPGGTTTLTTDNGLIENLNFVSSGAAANTVTVAGNAAWQLTGSAAGNGTTVTGTQNLTLVGDPDQFTGLSIVKGAGYTNTLTLKLNADATAAKFEKAVVDVVQLSADLKLGAVTTNTSSLVKLSADQATAAVTFQVDNATDTLADGAGTLSMDLGVSQTKVISTGSHVGTLALTDTTTAIALAGLTLDAKTTGVALSGTKDLTVDKLTVAADSSFVATSYSGNLTITDTAGAFKATVIGGSGNDTITKVTGWTGGEIRGGDGNDSIDTSNVAVAFKIMGENGNDTIKFDGASTVLGGAGTDTITQVGTLAAVINGGDGIDTINLVANSTATVQMGAASTWGDIVNIFAEGASKSVLDFSVLNGYGTLSHGTTTNAVNFLNAAGTIVGANNTVVVNQTANAAVTTAAALQAAGWSVVGEAAGNHYIVIQANSATQVTVFDVVSNNTDGAITAADTVTLVGTLTGLTAASGLVAGNFSVV